MNLTLMGPILRPLDQMRAHGVLPHVVPFPGVGLRRAQNVVEESFLPERSEVALLPQRLRQRHFENLHPPRKARALRRDGHEEVEVVRHQDVSSDEDATCCRLLGKGHKSMLHARLSEQPPPPVRGCGDENEGAGCEEPAQTLEPRLVHILWRRAALVAVALSYAPGCSVELCSTIRRSQIAATVSVPVISRPALPSASPYAFVSQAASDNYNNPRRQRLRRGHALLSWSRQEIEKYAKNEIDTEELEAFEPVGFAVHGHESDHAHGKNDGGDFQGMKHQGHGRIRELRGQDKQRRYKKRNLDAAAHRDVEGEVHVLSSRHHDRRGVFGCISHGCDNHQADKKFSPPQSAGHRGDLPD